MDTENTVTVTTNGLEFVSNLVGYTMDASGIKYDVSRIRDFILSAFNVETKLIVAQTMRIALEHDPKYIGQELICDLPVTVLANIKSLESQITELMDLQAQGLDLLSDDDKLQNHAAIESSKTQIVALYLSPSRALVEATTKAIAKANARTLKKYRIKFTYTSSVVTEKKDGSLDYSSVYPHVTVTTDDSERTKSTVKTKLSAGRIDSNAKRIADLKAAIALAKQEQASDDNEQVTEQASNQATVEREVQTLSDTMREHNAS